MKATIKRFFKYRDALFRFQGLGFVKIFSDNLAEAVRSTSAQVRKDFSLFGISGHKRGGYVVKDLLQQLDVILGRDKPREVILVGCGHIGKALINYRGFEPEGIMIKAAFDTDPTKVRRESVPPILPLDELSAYVQHHGMTLAILAVPEEAAQSVMDALESAGIQGVLNFAPVELKTSPDTHINNINLRLELQVVNYFVNATHKRKQTTPSKEGIPAT